MNKQDFIDEWGKAIDAGTFLTPKHDPTGLAVSWDTFRTVLSADAAENLAGFIKSGEYTIASYSDSKFPKSSGLFELLPTGAVPFDVAGSGVAPKSLDPSGSFDRLVVVHSKKVGWHTYVDDSTDIENRIMSGRLVLNYELQ